MRGTRNSLVVAAVLLSSLFTNLSPAVAVEMAPGLERKTLLSGSPYDEVVIEKTLRAVAQVLQEKYFQRHEDLVERVMEGSLPQPYESESYEGPEIPPFIEKWNFDPRGINIFLPPKVVLLNEDAIVHNLAHEMVHFIQYNYLGMNTDADMTSDHAEYMAVMVQRHFDVDRIDE